MSFFNNAACSVGSRLLTSYKSNKNNFQDFFFIYVCMYVCMYVYMYVCMDGWMYVSDGHARLTSRQPSCNSEKLSVFTCTAKCSMLGCRA